MLYVKKMHSVGCYDYECKQNAGALNDRMIWITVHMFVYSMPWLFETWISEDWINRKLPFLICLTIQNII